MATINFIPDSIKHEVEDGTRLIELCDEIDSSLSFGCTEGSCGVCELTVVSGMKNLSRVTEEEENYLLEEDLAIGMRLGCQLAVRKGLVEIKWKKLKSK